MTPEVAVLLRAALITLAVFGLEAWTNARRRAKTRPRGHTPIYIHHAYTYKAGAKPSMRGKRPARA